VTEAEILAQIEYWQTALRKSSEASEYTVGGIRNGRQLKRAPVEEIRATLDWLNKKLIEIRQGGQIRVRRGVL